jgi:sugar lactone lactonase YvrE
MIRAVSPSGVPAPFAGAYEVAGSADGTGAGALFNNPAGVALDAGGNVYVADQGNNTIRKITPGGVVTTLAGTAGVAGSADGTGRAALFNKPFGIAVDAAGNVYVSDTNNETIRVITPAGVVTTLAGKATMGGSADGTGAAAQFALPEGIALDASGDLYVADTAHDSIRKVTPSGVVTTFAGTLGDPGSADGTGAAARFYFPAGLAMDGGGNLFVADSYNDTIRRITPSGAVTTLAGTPGMSGYTGASGATALFNNPLGIAVDGSGNVYVADTNNGRIRKGSVDGTPRIHTQPADQLVAAGASATFSAVASGSAALSYQWNFNGVAIPGATSPSYTVTNVQAPNAGSYTVTIADGDGSVMSAAASLSVSSGNPTTRLVNLSTRAQVGPDGDIIVAGFVIAGSNREQLLVRGVGPGLTQFGVAGALARPSLGVYDSSGNQVASNSGWGSNSNPGQIASVASQVGAFPLASGSADCALLVNLPAGQYTAQISGLNGTTGIALAEVYEVSSAGTRLINISTRAEVGTGGSGIIAGFVVAGAGSEQVLVRGVGPGLAQFGVTGALAQTGLQVFGPSGNVIASDTGWDTGSNTSQIMSVEGFVGAFSLASGSADSAQIVNLAPGAYTLQVAGVDGAAGIGLAEVYEVP